MSAPTGYQHAAHCGACCSYHKPGECLRFPGGRRIHVRAASEGVVDLTESLRNIGCLFEKHNIQSDSVFFAAYYIDLLNGERDRLEGAGACDRRIW